MLKVVFKQNDKILLNKVRFDEVLDSDLSAPVIGQLDVPKSTLERLGWKPNENLVLSLKRENEPKPYKHVLVSPEPPEGYETWGRYIEAQRKEKK